MKSIVKNRERGDVKKIHETTGLARPTILDALNRGECSEETFNKIAGFYKEKKESQEKLMSQTLEGLS